MNDGLFLRFQIEIIIARWEELKHIKIGSIKKVKIKNITNGQICKSLLLKLNWLNSPRATGFVSET